MATSLREKVVQGALASGSAEIAARVLTIVLSIATARALQPREVGLLGLVVIITGIISLVASCSETAGVTGRDQGTDKQYATAAACLRGLATALLLVATLTGLPHLTRLLVGAEGADGQLAALAQMMLWVPVLELVGSYPRVILQRRLDLGYLAGVNLLQVAANVGLSIALLWLGYGVPGVIGASLAATGVGSIALWLRLRKSAPRREAVLPGSELCRQTAIGTAKVFAGNFLGYLNGRLDNLLVAGALGPTAMSFYAMAWNVSRTPALVLSRSLEFVLVPALARVQGDAGRIERSLHEALRHSYLLLAPVSAAVFVCAPSLVTLVLGAKWLPIVPPLRVMCVTVLIDPFLQAARALAYSTGKAHLIGIATTFHSLALVLSVQPLALRWNILGASFADMAGGLILASVLYLTARITARHIRWRLIATITVPVVAAVCAGLLAGSVGAYLKPGLFRLAVESGLLLICYPATVTLLGGWDKLAILAASMRGALRRPSLESAS